MLWFRSDTISAFISLNFDNSIAHNFKSFNFLFIDDAMVEKSGMHFERCSKLYDHAVHPFQRATAEAPGYPEDRENIRFEGNSPEGDDWGGKGCFPVI